MQWALGCSAVVVALLLSATSVYARAHRSQSSTTSQFAAASELQEALEARPVEQRTRHDYQRVIDAYRRIYLRAPISPKAEPSVVAAGQMTEEMGRRFRDADILRSAVKQYEFLRREYPGSKFRFDALYRIGEIYKDDLHDKASADAVFEEFLRRYPRNQLADAARSALAEPVRQASLQSKRTAGTTSPEAKTRRANTLKSSDTSTGDDDANDDSVQNIPAKDDVAKKDSAEESSADDASDSQEASGKVSRVLGIRHWSTPEYTRVAIDLDQNVKFESQRINNPDRIFFDLLNTKIDRKLAGKSFEVNDSLLRDVRVAQFKAGQSRIVLDLEGSSQFTSSLLANPPRLMIEIRGGDGTGVQAHVGKAAPIVSDLSSSNEATADSDSAAASTPSPISDSRPLPPPNKKPARRVTVGQNGVKKTIIDDDDNDDLNTETSVAKLDPPEIKPVNNTVVTPEPAVHAANPSVKSKRKAATADLDVREAQPTASGDRSLIRALGLKIGKIVIDPGHGGHDTGTIGSNGLEEKDLVLDVSRRLGKLLQSRLGAEVVYTRKDDTFIPLETRTAIANQESADLFVSVHANSSHDPDARGVETYYLNFTSSPEALEVAARENAVSEKSIHELQDLVKKIALREKIEESHEFASDVQNSLHSGLAAKNPGLRDRGVKKAPFIVLIGANMPSILAEISFVSNPGDEHRLQTPEYRQKIAESLYRGIAKYVSGLSGVKVASKIDKDEGQ